MRPWGSLSQKFAPFSSRMGSWIYFSEHGKLESSIGDEDFVKIVADWTGSEQHKMHERSDELQDALRSAYTKPRDRGAFRRRDCHWRRSRSQVFGHPVEFRIDVSESCAGRAPYCTRVTNVRFPPKADISELDATCPRGVWFGHEVKICLDGRKKFWSSKSRTENSSSLRLFACPSDQTIALWHSKMSRICGVFARKS